MLNAESLRNALIAPLPGRPFQETMAPSWRRGSINPDSAPARAFRRASVLILLYPGRGSLYFPLIVRSEDAGPHAGQIGFPGGAAEKGENVAEAALREAHEELGIDPRLVEVCGALTPFAIDVSRFTVTPVVGMAAVEPDFRPSPAEVAAWFPVALEELLDPLSVGSSPIIHDGAEYSVPCYRFSGRIVWGATAIALAEFAQIVRLAGGAASGA